MHGTWQLPSGNTLTLAEAVVARSGRTTVQLVVREYDTTGVLVQRRRYSDGELGLALDWIFGVAGAVA